MIFSQMLILASDDGCAPWIRPFMNEVKYIIIVVLIYRRY